MYSFIQLFDKKVFIKYLRKIQPEKTDFTLNIYVKIECIIVIQILIVQYNE